MRLREEERKKRRKGRREKKDDAWEVNKEGPPRRRERGPQDDECESGSRCLAPIRSWEAVREMKDCSQDENKKVI
jgi:hypothetical protein